MRFLLPVAVLALSALSACDKAPANTPAAPAPILTTEQALDEFTHARPQEARVTHVALDLALDFAAKEVGGTATLDVLAAPGASEVVLRARIKTLPGKQWGTKRAYNAIVKRIFDERDIEIPFPHQTLYFGVGKDVKSPPMHMVREDEPLPHLIELLAKSNIKRLSVVSNGRLTGMISRVDVLRHLAITYAKNGQLPH